VTLLCVCLFYTGVGAGSVVDDVGIGVGVVVVDGAVVVVDGVAPATPLNAKKVKTTAAIRNGKVITAAIHPAPPHEVVSPSSERLPKKLLHGSAVVGHIPPSSFSSFAIAGEIPPPNTTNEMNRVTQAAVPSISTSILPIGSTIPIK